MLDEEPIPTLLAVEFVFVVVLFALALPGVGPSILTFVICFQTLLAGILAVGGVWWSFSFHRQQQLNAHTHQESIRLQSMIMSIYHDLVILAGQSKIRQRIAEKALEKPETTEFLTDENLIPLEKVADVPSIHYWRPRLGVWKEFGQSVLALASLRESVSFSLMPNSKFQVEDIAGRLEKIMRMHASLYQQANTLHQAIAAQYPDLVDPVEDDPALSM